MTTAMHPGTGDADDVTTVTAVPTVSPFQRLVQGRMRERDWSYGDIARRSGLPRSTVHHLSTASTVRAPRPATLKALADALELPLATLQSAAAEAAGLAVDVLNVDPDTAVLIAGLSELSAEDRRHVSALISSLRAKQAPPA